MTPAVPHKFPRILLVEDNQDDFEATVRSFKKANLLNPVDWCRSGEEAMKFLNEAEEYPGLILLDLNMPGLDGRNVLETLKKDEELKAIPVVILTTSSDERDIHDCYASGANTYIQKPVGFENLVEAAVRIKEYWFATALLPLDQTTE